ncbi:IclR family transcriptional regulator [Arthrobacter crystallopoietes]|uniref:IclR family transcriptional regulator n=1 Tax=Crystallibacter crystallopoietes TaxID=37928 RepID=UPI0011112C93|nr:IclR family transcriptional regulator [Arthrobacter crystallopoietes]
MRNVETSPVESVDRALLLILLMRSAGPISVKAAAEHLNVAPSTAHRLLSALTFRGFSVQDRERRYRAGPALSERGAESFSVHLLRVNARSALMALHEAVGETVQLMVLRGGSIVFIDGVESTSALRVGMRVGDQMPAFVSAGGKAMLAQLSNTELEELYRGGLPPWPTGRITSLALLKRNMTRIRRAEFATNFEETEQGVVGLGVSINDAAGKPIAALTTATPSIRFRREDMPAYIEALRTAAAAVEDRLRAAVS